MSGPHSWQLEIFLEYLFFTLSILPLFPGTWKLSTHCFLLFYGKVFDVPFCERFYAYFTIQTHTEDSGPMRDWFVDGYRIERFYWVKTLYLLKNKSLDLYMDGFHEGSRQTFCKKRDSYELSSMYCSDFERYLSRHKSSAHSLYYISDFITSSSRVPRGVIRFCSGLFLVYVNGI